MKIVSIIGARPQFVKAAPVSRALRQLAHEVLVHTGQHYDYGMSDIFFQQLDIPQPDHNLGVGSGSHGWQTGQMLIRIEEVLLTERPDCVLVYGDTNSTLAGALAAVKLHIPVAHVEAGLRSFNRSMPEEHNRVLTDHVADLLFCPTQTAVDNLLREGITQGVYLVGDVMYDALLHNVALAESQSTILADLGLVPRQYLLATVHRASNTDARERLAAILAAFAQAGEPIVFPTHPRTRKQMTAFGLPIAPNVRLLDPLNYFDNLVLQKHARLVLTDSGGMQKEAYCLGTPCVTMRDQTEWAETVAAGWNTLTGADTQRIVAAMRSFSPPADRPLLYGDGRSAERVASILKYSRGQRER